jgi:hypothetical protein
MIDPAGLLLAIVDVEDALSNRLLQDVGLERADPVTAGSEDGP